MKATEALKHEHDAVKLMMRIMETIAGRIKSGQKVPRQDLDNMTDFLKVFVDRCHHGKEEKILFPVLEEAGISKTGGPMCDLLAEHEQGREYTRNISRALINFEATDNSRAMELSGNMKAYIELLNEHILKENDVLFPMADKVLTEEVQGLLYDQFEELEEEVIGIGKHEELHKMLEKMSDTYLD
ncbi:MAG: hemerythrin [Synergistaceae bacterium]|nr:hemerythrin [Synergistaceae bacterium]